MPGAYSGDDAWKAACDEADRLDPKWRWDELQAKRPNLPPERDAIQVALAAAAKLPLVFHSHGIFDTDSGINYLNSTVKHEMTWAEVPASVNARNQQFRQDLSSDPSRSRLPPPLLSILGDAIASAADAKKLAIGLVDMHAGRAASLKRPIMLNLPNDVPMRQIAVAQTLRLCSILAAHENQPDHALLCCRAITGVARAVPQPSMLFTALISSSTRNALATAVMRTLAVSEPNEFGLSQAQADVQSLLDEPLLLEAMRGERAILEENYVENDRGEDVMGAFDAQMRHHNAPKSLFHRIDRWIRKLFAGEVGKSRAAKEFEFYTTVIELLKGSPDALIAKPKAIKSMRKRAGRIVSFMLREIGFMLHVDRLQRALLSSIVCVLACERFRISNHRWPRELLELTPDYVQNVPLNPFTLQPLSYSVESESVIVRASDRRLVFVGGVIPCVSGFQRGDIAVRLWNPELRKMQ